jgi:superfamily II DNA or RNA helicase
MRLDGQDIRCQGLFGPVRMKVTYQEAQAHRMVAPMAIFWTDVVTDRNPCAGLEDTDKLRAGIWAHTYRNQLIAADARRYGPETQVLITVATVEHALHLKRLLPEFQLVYSGMAIKSSDLRAWARAGLIDDDFAAITDRQRQQRTRAFEAGTLKKVIVTTVWNVGVNLLHLDVLVRGDAGGSPINDTQVPGRNARAAHGKEVGIVHDYKDQFDAGFRRKAASRRDTYALHGWAQHEPGPNQQAELLALMENSA